MPVNYLYKAMSTEEVCLSVPDPTKLAGLSPLAVGVYFHLRWSQPKNISQLGVVSPRISYTEIGKALEELIDSGLVTGDVEL